MVIILFFKLAFYDVLLCPFVFFYVRTKINDSVKKSPLFVTVPRSGSAVTANVYEVSEPRVESCSCCCPVGCVNLAV